MARAQNSAKGLFQKDRIDVGSNSITGNSTALILDAGLKVSNAQTITANSTAVVFGGGVKVSNAQTLTANSTGLVFGDPASTLPGSVDNGVLIGLISNSTGVALFINSTGTTHVYLNVTSIQPT